MAGLNPNRFVLVLIATYGFVTSSTFASDSALAAPPNYNFDTPEQRDGFFVGKLALSLRAEERCGKRDSPYFYLIAAAANKAGMSTSNIVSKQVEIRRTLDILRYPDQVDDAQWCEWVEHFLSGFVLN